MPKPRDIKLRETAASGADAEASHGDAVTEDEPVALRKREAAHRSFAEVNAQLRRLRQRVALLEHFQDVLEEQFTDHDSGPPAFLVQLDGHTAGVDADVLETLSRELCIEAQRVRDQIFALTRSSFTVEAAAESALFEEGDELLAVSPPMPMDHRDERVVRAPSARSKVSMTVPKGG